MDGKQIKEWFEQAEEYASSLFQTYEVGWDNTRNERFAALVAAHEREQCAQLCHGIWYAGYISDDAHRCMDAIRARGEGAKT